MEIPLEKTKKVWYNKYIIVSSWQMSGNIF